MLGGQAQGGLHGLGLLLRSLLQMANRCGGDVDGDCVRVGGVEQGLRLRIGRKPRPQ